MVTSEYSWIESIVLQKGYFNLISLEEKLNGGWYTGAKNRGQIMNFVLDMK